VLPSIEPADCHQ